MLSPGKSSRSMCRSFAYHGSSPFVAGRHYFREFLRSEYSEENFLFWMSCESLKNEQNPDIIEEKARLIYEDYISILSPKEVSKRRRRSFDDDALMDCLCLVSSRLV